jgi:hypothetical protein
MGAAKPDPHVISPVNISRTLTAHDHMSVCRVNFGGF